MYRVIYYLIPFALAILLIAASEVHRQRLRVAAFATGVASVAGRWVPAMLPTVLSASTLVGGAMLLLSGATPAVRGRMAILDSVLPLGVIELSHFLASLAGAGLIVLAWAIHRRLDAAYGLTIGLLYVGIITSLLKGLDWEEAVTLAVVMGVVVPSRRAFYRKAALLSEPFEPKWIITVVAVVGAATWLGFFSYKHVEYADQLWWQFRPSRRRPAFHARDRRRRRRAVRVRRHAPAAARETGGRGADARRAGTRPCHRAGRADAQPRTLRCWATRRCSSATTAMRS